MGRKTKRASARRTKPARPKLATANLLPANGVEGPADAREAARTAGVVRRLANDPAWVMPEGAEVELPRIMMGIARKSKTTVATMMGPVKVDNQRAQIQATKTLVAMRGQNQDDRHHHERLHQDDKHLAVDAAKAIAAMGREDKEALIRRAGLGHLLGDTPVAHG